MAAATWTACLLRDPTTPLRQMGAECVVSVFLSARWSHQRGPRHVFDVIDQCFTLAQTKMCELWKRDADLVLEPDVNGFSDDCFERFRKLIVRGEDSMRAVVPRLRTMLNLLEPFYRVPANGSRFGVTARSRTNAAAQVADLGLQLPEVKAIQLGTPRTHRRAAEDSSTRE